MVQHCLRIGIIIDTNRICIPQVNVIGNLAKATVTYKVAAEDTEILKTLT